MKTFPNCRHCGDTIPLRVGRGLCRVCWNNKEIRVCYPPVATFGGNVHVQLRTLKAPPVATTGETP